MALLSLRSFLALGALSLCHTAFAAPAFDSESPFMFGDWNGTRGDLSAQGYDFKLDYTGEVGANLHGGYNHDHATRYSDQFAVGTHLDLQKILGWHDAEFQLTLTNRNGDNISNDRINDPRVGGFTSAQEVWGRGNITRITQMWYQQKFLDQRLDIKVGRFGEGEDFNSFPCDFQNLAFCGSQVGNWVGSVWYNWPVSQWALRAKYHLTPELYAQVGIFEQNPSNLENDNGFKLSGSGTEGAMLPVELVWTPRLNGLPGEYRGRRRCLQGPQRSGRCRHRPGLSQRLQQAWLLARRPAAVDQQGQRPVPWPERVRQRHAARQEDQRHR
jgi:porin